MLDGTAGELKERKKERSYLPLLVGHNQSTAKQSEKKTLNNENAVQHHKKRHHLKQLAARVSEHDGSDASDSAARILPSLFLSLLLTSIHEQINRFQFETIFNFFP
jgi:hypothetical protein